MLCRVLSSPVYGGAYAYGRSERTVQYDHGQPRTVSRRKPSKLVKHGRDIPQESSYRHLTSSTPENYLVSGQRPPASSRSPRARLGYAQMVTELVNTPTTFQNDHGTGTE